MTDYRRFENGQWHNANGYAPDRANGCLIGFCWIIVIVVLGLTVLAMNHGAAGLVNWIIAAL